MSCVISNGGTSKPSMHLLVHYQDSWETVVTRRRAGEWLFPTHPSLSSLHHHFLFFFSTLLSIFPLPLASRACHGPHSISQEGGKRSLNVWRFSWWTTRMTCFLWFSYGEGRLENSLALRSGDDKGRVGGGVSLNIGGHSCSPSASPSPEHSSPSFSQSWSAHAFDRSTLLVPEGGLKHSFPILTEAGGQEG